MIEQYVDVYLDDDAEVSSRVLVGFFYSHEDGYEVVTVTAEDGYVHHWSEIDNCLKVQVYDGLEDHRECSKQHPQISGTQCLKLYK